jgi:hypothetical protein
VGWKKERVEAAFRIVREKEFLAKQEAERGEDEPPEGAKPEPETQTPAGQAQQGAAPTTGKTSPAPPTQIANAAPPQVATQIPPSQLSKKQPFQMPNIFGKKAQAPSAPLQQSAASPGSMPSSQQIPPVRPPQIPSIPNAQQSGQQAIPPPSFPVQQQKRQEFPAQQAKSPVQPPSLQPRPEPKTGLPIASLWPSGSPTSALPYELPYHKVADESQVKNPAFAKIENASAKLPENKFLPIILVAFIVLLFVAGAAYYFLVLGGSSGPRAPIVPTPAASNATNTPNETAIPALPAANVSNSTSANTTFPQQEQPPAKFLPSGFNDLAKIVDSASALPSNYKISFESRLGKGGSTEQLSLETTYVKGSKMRQDTSWIIGRNAGIEKRQYALGEAVYDCVKIGDGWSCGEASYQLPPPAQLQLTPSSMKSDPYASTIITGGTAQISGVTANCFNETVGGGYVSRFCIGQDASILYMKAPANVNGRILDLENTRTSYTAAVSDSDFELPSALAANATAATPKQEQNNSSQSIPILIVPSPIAPMPAPVPEPKLVRITRHVATAGDPVIKFCKLHGGVFLQAHYTEFWGVDCFSSKGKEGFANQSQFPTQCEFLSCCVNDLSTDFSRNYDYFECGYYS